MGKEQKIKLLQLVSMYMLRNGQPGRKLNAIAYPQLMLVVTEFLVSEYNQSHVTAQDLASEILNYMRERTAIVAEIGERLYGFVHRTFMEYSAASSIRSEVNARRSDYDWINDEIVTPNWNQDEWREVLLLLIGMISDQDSPVGEMIERLSNLDGDPPLHKAFAARCLAEADAAGQQQLADTLFIDLAGAIPRYTGSRAQRSVEFVEEALQAIAVLARVSEVPDEMSGVIRSLDEQSSLQARMAAWQLGFAQETGEGRRAFALRELEGEQEAVRRASIRVLEQEWPGRDDVRAALIDVIREDSHTRVKQAALEALERGWAKDGRVLDAIRSQLDGELPYTYAEALVNYLATSWEGHFEALELVLDLAAVRFRKVRGWEPDINRAAADAITRSWANQDALLRLLEVLEGGEAESPRWTAAATAAAEVSAFVELPERERLRLRDILKELVASSNPALRRAATLAWGKALDDTEAGVLLSEDLDGFAPGLDSRKPIPESRVIPAAEALEVEPAEILKRYEGFVERDGVPLILAWRPEEAERVRSLVDDEDREIAVSALVAAVESFGDRDAAFDLARSYALGESTAQSDIRPGSGWNFRPSVREGAVELIADQLSFHADSRRLLGVLASDPDSGIRQTAIAGLSHAFADHPETLPLLLSKVRDDDGAWESALSVLLEGFAEREEAWAAVNERARDEDSAEDLALILEENFFWRTIFPGGFSAPRELYGVMRTLTQSESKDVRQTAMLLWGNVLPDGDDRMLLTHDADGWEPGIDPVDVIGADRVRLVARHVGKPEADIRASYERLADEDRVPIRLAWRP